MRDIRHQRIRFIVFRCRADHTLITAKSAFEICERRLETNYPNQDPANKAGPHRCFFLREQIASKGRSERRIERFSEFSNLLFLKLISEIENRREEEGRNRSLEARYCWDAFAQKPQEEMLDYINDTVLPRLVNSYNHSGEVFQSRLLIVNPSTLHAIIEKLSPLSLLDTESDVKGDAFEYFLKYSITVGNDLGEYFTPRHIVKLMVELIDPAYGETVYDPCCGTGGFLIEAFKHIERKVAITPETRRFLEKKNHLRERTYRNGSHRQDEHDSGWRWTHKHLPKRCSCISCKRPI